LVIIIATVLFVLYGLAGGSGKTEISCRTGWTYGNFLKRFATLGWAFTGVFAAFLYAGLTMENRELAFGIMARNFLPVGLVGLMIAALAATVMSTCDAFMVHSSALFARNVYLPFINPKASDRKLLKVGRWVSIITVITGIIFAFVFPSVVQGLVELWKVTAYLGISFWFGVIWRRANRYGAWTSAIFMAITSIYTGNILGWSLPTQIAIYLPLGILTMIIVSKLTPPESHEKLRQFYMLLDTPVGDEQRLKDAKVDIKLEGISISKEQLQKNKSKIDRFLSKGKVADGLLLVDLLSLYKKFSWQRYRVDIIGFSIAAFIAVFIIILALFLAQIGA
jgi:Na+/proline symporter